MFAEQQRVTIRSTPELPTVFDGQDAFIRRQHKKHPEFWCVLTLSGESGVYHESQLVPKKAT